MLPPRIKEEAAIVLDYLPNGYPFDTRPMHKKSPVIQALGTRRFVLLELVPRKDTPIMTGDEIYIGEGKRDKIHHINGRLPFDKLTNMAKQELEHVVRDVIKKEESRFVDFFNKAQPLTTRMHQIELLPGIGKKHMWEIIEQRKDRPFMNFADIKTRVKLITDPEKAVFKRIMAEIEGKEKHRLFAD